jgi:hypothetical protein
MDGWLLTPDNPLRKKLPDISQIDSNKKSRAALITGNPAPSSLKDPWISVPASWWVWLLSMAA